MGGVSRGWSGLWMLTVLACGPEPDGEPVAGPYSWPPIGQVAAPGCTLPPSLAEQPAHAGPPDTLPDIVSVPGMADLRTCFAETVRAQAWTVFSAAQNQEPTHHMGVGGVHFFAHENLIEATPQAALTKYVDYLEAAGVQLVGIHMGSFPWLCASDAQPDCVGSEATKAKYDAVMAALRGRAMGARLMLPIADSTRFPMSSWEAYRDSMLQVVQALLARYRDPGGASALEQVGMHEPSSVEQLILRKTNPSAVLDPTRWRDELVNPICALAHQTGALCTASLIPSPASVPDSEARFIDAAITSDSDMLGVNNIHFFGLEASIVLATSDFIERFRTGTLTTGDQARARGDTVFINAAWRAAWPMTPGQPLGSNAAGLGCSDLDAVDESYLGALFAYARSKHLASVTVFYTTSFIGKRSCPKDVRMYASVQSPGNPTVLWPHYQQGSAIFDPEYRSQLSTALSQSATVLTPTGQRFGQLARLASGR